MSQIIKKYYNQITSYGMNSFRRKKILNLINIDNLKNKRILDMACASGYLARELKQSNNYVAAIDISEENISKVKHQIDKTVVLDIENEDWPTEFINNKFDIIIAGEIIEHLFDQENFLKKIKQLLKSDSILIMTTPNFLLWNNRLRMFFGQYGEKEVLYDKSHIHLLSYYGFKKLLEKSAFNIVAEDNIWYPNKLEKVKKFLPPNLFIFQSIFKLKLSK